MDEGGETPKPRRAESISKPKESAQGNFLRAPAVFLTLLGAAAGGYYATQHEDPGIGGFLNQDEPRNERVTTGQLFADSQLASVDSQPNDQKENSYSTKLEQARKEMGDLITPEVVGRIRLYEP